MNPDNDNLTLDLDEVDAVTEFDAALKRGNWVLASEIQAGNIDKGQLPPGFGFKVRPDARDVR